MIELDWYVDAHPGQTYQFVRGNDPEPAAWDYKPSSAINIEAVSRLQALTSADTIQFTWLEAGGKWQNERRNGHCMTLHRKALAVERLASGVTRQERVKLGQ